MVGPKKPAEMPADKKGKKKKRGSVPPWMKTGKDGGTRYK